MTTLLVKLSKNLQDSNTEQINSVSEEYKPQTNQRVVKKCLSEVMESIRIILLSAFCANSTDQNITLSLQRAGSQVEGKQSKLAEDKDLSQKAQEEE